MECEGMVSVVRKKSRSNVHDERTRWPPIFGHGMIRTQKFRENDRFTICCITRIFFFLEGPILRGDQDTKDMLDWLKGLAAAIFCDGGIQKLVPRCDMCRNLHDVYVEK